MRKPTRDKRQRIKNLGTGMRKESLDKMLLHGFSLSQARKVMVLLFNERICKHTLTRYRRYLFEEHGITFKEAREQGRMLLSASRQMPWLSKDKGIRDLWYEMKNQMKGEELTPEG